MPGALMLCARRETVTGEVLKDSDIFKLTRLRFSGLCFRFRFKPYKPYINPFGLKLFHWLAISSLSCIESVEPGLNPYLWA